MQPVAPANPDVAARVAPLAVTTTDAPPTTLKRSSPPPPDVSSAAQWPESFLIRVYGIPPNMPHDEAIVLLKTTPPRTALAYIASMVSPTYHASYVSSADAREACRELCARTTAHGNKLVARQVSGMPGWVSDVAGPPNKRRRIDVIALEIQQLTVDELCSVPPNVRSQLLELVTALTTHE